MTSRIDLCIAWQNLATAQILGGFAWNPLHAVIAPLNHTRDGHRLITIFKRSTHCIVFSSISITGDCDNRNAGETQCNLFQNGAASINNFVCHDIYPIAKAT